MVAAVLLLAGILAGIPLEKWRRVFSHFEKAPPPGEGKVGGRDCSLLWPDSWLAVRSRNLLAVQAALSLHQPKPCSWVEGFINADYLFVAPPVKGWVLVTGAGLPEPSQDVDACFRFVVDLSRKLGQVQFFSANRYAQYHAWVKAEHGRIVRAYAWAGMTVWQQGNSTVEELELGLHCFDYAEPALLECATCLDLFQSNVHKVPLLAARWGLDPALVREHLFLNECGVVGKAAHRY
jgi:hypothetical protein